MMCNLPKVTVVIPVWNSEKWIPGCFDSLARQTFVEFSLTVIDNGSSDNSVEIIKERDISNITLVELEKNIGFAAAVNMGIKSASSPYVALLNIDTIPADDWLEKLVETMDAAPSTITSLASKMLDMKDSALIDSAGDTLSWYGSAFKRGHGESAKSYTEKDYVFSACAGAALYRRSLFDTIGFFDERFVSYFEDVDLGFREKLFGFKCLFVPEAKVLHHGHSAGVVGGYYVFLLTRNRLLTLVKNVPLDEMLHHFGQLLYGQVYFFIMYKRPVASLKGYFSAVRMLTDVLRDRKLIQKQSQGKMSAGWLESTLGEPGIFKRLMAKII